MRLAGVCSFTPRAAQQRTLLPEAAVLRHKQAWAQRNERALEEQAAAAEPVWGPWRCVAYVCCAPVFLFVMCMYVCAQLVAALERECDELRAQNRREAQEVGVCVRVFAFVCLCA